jgi:two-component system, cell cycle sensor histidine kinase and response regulator CckA
MQPKILDMNQAIGSVVRMLQRLLGENIDLQLDYASRLPSVRADVGMLEQALVNLAVNARDAMPQGGRLKLRTFEREVDETQAQRHPEARAGQFVCLSVTDTGCGMDATVRSHLFEPFFTTKEVGKGTGLGLATIYGIVKQHEGWIEVDSAVGQGTTFTLFLPAVFAAAESSGATSTNPSVRGGSETVLVVEDEPALRALMRGVLSRYGYVTLEAADGLEALRVWRQNAAKVRLLLTDLVMPGGISGRELAEQLQAEQPTLKVIYTSGYSLDMAGQELAMKPGFSFLAKPYAPAVLALAVRRALDDDRMMMPA